MAVDLNQATPARAGVAVERPRLVWVDPRLLLRYVVHDAGASGRPYPELVRDGEQQRARANAALRHGLFTLGWRCDEPAVLHVDSSTGLARLRDGNHRTWFAVEQGVTRVPVRIAPGRVRNRGTTVAAQYRGEFDASPVVTTSANVVSVANTDS
jgi:hypothetical protein